MKALWLCRECCVVVCPRPTEEAPEHRHRLEAIAPMMGPVVRAEGRAWRCAGWDAAGVLWGMPCDDGGADLQPGKYAVERVPPMARPRWEPKPVEGSVGPALFPGMAVNTGR